MGCGDTSVCQWTAIVVQFFLFFSHTFLIPSVEGTKWRQAKHGFNMQCASV